MAQLDQVVLVDGKLDDTRRLVEESTSNTGKSSDFFTAKEDPSRTSSKDSTRCASDAAPSSSEFFSTHDCFSKQIEGMMERSEFGSNLESEIESSKMHWTGLMSDSDEERSAAADSEVYRTLQQQYGIEHKSFFMDFNAKLQVGLGEKIAEGGQAEIFEARWLLPEHASWNHVFVVKVFKMEGWTLQEVQKQFPPAMLQRASTLGDGFYHCARAPGFAISLGGMMMEGRFAFWMTRHWGDLRKLIDLRMQHNGNQAPPFTAVTTMRIIYSIAKGMKGLHEDNIVHRDLKASNVLIWPLMWKEGDAPRDIFNPVSDDNFGPVIADFECSLGIVGTLFWRAPEILLRVKNRRSQSIVFTEKSDVYSYAMTCYEIWTGKIPLEDLHDNDYDAVLQGARPILPRERSSPWIESFFSRCWHSDPSMRPSFAAIIDAFQNPRESWPQWSNERWQSECSR